jgi:glycosyltransferase involved in cell wall biosynthesis
MATPVIATDIGAPPETVLGRPGVAADRATGWLVPPEDAERLAGALTEALAMTPEDYTRMGARAREHVLNAFSLKQMKQQTLQVYDRLLGTTLAEPA